jgi:hypothetical protein
MNFSTMILAVSVVMELFLVSAERHDDLLTASIESTELWYNPWPAPNDQARVADEPRRIPSSVCVAAGDSRTSASDGVGAACYHCSSWDGCASAPGVIIGTFPAPKT